MGYDKEKQRAYMREWYAANREKMRARAREWYAANREKKLARTRTYYETNREEMLVCQREYALSRRAVTNECKSLLINYKGGRCHECLKSYQDIIYNFHHVDHRTKKYNICEKIRIRCRARTAAQVFDELKDEADKTILVCANCHALIHEEEGYLHNRNRTSTQSSDEIYSEPTPSTEPQYSAPVTTERPHTYIQMILVDLDGENESEMAG